MISKYIMLFIVFPTFIIGMNQPNQTTSSDKGVLIPWESSEANKVFKFFDDPNTTLLHIAIKTGSTDFVRFLLPYCELSTLNKVRNGKDGLTCIELIKKEIAGEENKKNKKNAYQLSQLYEIDAMIEQKMQTYTQIEKARENLDKINLEDEKEKR